ncbi:MAG: glycosyltransferase family 4 protein [Candidatus Marinimicrobia bacterium]|nr:glycosyltransferase family 4 protein [Candidatus Neomarinimicrobiota bacterium]
MTPSTPLKKVLIITYYWPPAGGPGVQRVLKFAKYLPEFGWQPIVLTVKNGEYPAIDESMQNDIPSSCQMYKTASLEPNLFYKKFTGMAVDEKIPTAVLAAESTNWKKRLANWIRLNLFIPDAKIGWIPFAVRKGKKIIKTEKPDVIFSSSPPPTVHLIARKLAKWSGIKWVADFRDPWTDIHYYENQNRNKVVKQFDSYLERSVLRDADKISCISRLDIEEDFAKKTDPEKCVNIANGYDEADFRNIKTGEIKSKKFIILHIGAVGKERNPLNLFKAICKLGDEKIIMPETFTLRFIGHVDELVLQSIKSENIEPFVDFISYLPHSEALAKTMLADVMLLLVTQSEKNRRILPGKTFEYMRTGKPILALGPENGEVARILQQTKTGSIFDYQNEEEIFQKLNDLIRAWKKGKPREFKGDEQIQLFSRKKLTEKLTELFDEMISQ